MVSVLLLGPIAQLVELLPLKEMVEGSTPSRPIAFAPGGGVLGHVAEPGRRAGFRILSRKGWGFKSLHAQIFSEWGKPAGVAQW